MFHETDIEILGVQEHRLIHADPIEFKRLGSSYLVTSSGWRNEVQASQGGVGLLMGTKARKALLKVKSINKRIMLAEFDGNPKTSVIVVYAPTNCSSNEIAEEFFEELNNTISDIPAHNFLIVMGDFNSETTKETMIDFCDMYGLSNLIKEPTCYQNPSCIDAILTNKTKSFQHSNV